MGVPATGMALADIRSELIGQRFGPNMDKSLNAWIRLREGMIWSDSEWPFKRVRREALTITGGVPAMPVSFWKASMLERSDGSEVGFLSLEDFNRTYAINDSSTGQPDYYTVLNGQITLGPKGGTGTVYLSYDRRPCHYNTSDALTPGTMTLDTDYPIYPPEYHYLIVVGSMASGLKIQNDPTWDSLEQEFQQMLMLMREDLLPPDQYNSSQYGQDTL